MAFDAFALILAMLALGLVFSRLRILPDNAPDVLNRVVLYVCLPATILIHVPRLHFDGSLLGLALTPWLLTLVVIAIVTPLARWMKFSRATYAALLVCVSLGNTGFIGYPMIKALLDEQALPYAVVYDQVGTFLLLSTFGLYVLARFSGEGRPPAPRTLIKRMLTFPPVFALLFAVLLMPESPPAWIAQGLQRLGDMLLPLVMLAVGMSIRLKMPSEEIAPLGIGLTIKLLVMPALALLLSLAFGMQGDMLKVNVLESAMPSMVTAAALTIAANLAPRLAAALVGYSVLLSLVTLPMWLWLLERLAV